MYIKAPLILLLSLLMTMASCEKKQSTQPTGNNNQPSQTNGTQKCEIANLKLSTQFNLSQGAVDENLTVTYSGGFISTIKNETQGHQMNGSITEYIYSNSKLVRVNHKNRLNNGTPSNNYDSIFYNSNNQISLIKIFNDNGSLYGGQIFHYSGVNLVKKEFTWNGSLIDIYHYDTYTYDATGLLQTVRRHSNTGVENDNIVYTYSDKENKLYSNNPFLNTIFHNAFSGEQDIVYIGLLRNKKLIQQITYTKTGQTPISYNITYDLNNSGYPLNVKNSNDVIISYNYNCK